MCPVCEGNALLDREPTTVQVADSDELLSVLLQCGVCRQYFDYYEMGRHGPQPVTPERARQLYPGAVPLRDEPDGSGPQL